MNVIDSIGSLVLTTVSGVLIFSERFSARALIKCLVMVIAVAFTFFTRISSESKTGGKLWLLLILPANSALVWILQKAYVAYPGTVSDSSFCFFTNVFIIAVFCAVLPVQSKKSEEKCKWDGKRVFGKKVLLAAVFTVGTANVMQLLQLNLLTSVDIVLFNPISSSLNLIYSGAVSLLYKEKLRLLNYIAIALSIAVVFI